MPNIFDSIKLTKPNKNVFDLSHDVKLSFNMGELIPTMVLECVPGDKFNISCESLLRFAPLVAPVMHRVDVSMHYFFVPNRILWPNWENFITNTPDPVTDLPPAFPTFQITGNDVTNNFTRLLDYLGLPAPTVTGEPETVSALPIAAYNKIWFDYYRDQNLQPGTLAPLVDGANSSPDLSISVLRRAWEHDYFTSALPFAQKGDVVDLPIANFNDVPVKVNYSDPPDNLESQSWTANVTPTGTATTIADRQPADIDNYDTGKLYADTSNLLGQSTTINDLRRAFKLQEWLEKAARGGSRYIESILSHFGVRSSDKRLQRPEYITGTKSPVVISEVLNTSDTAEAPQGNMAGHAVSVTGGKYGNYYCEEHGYIIGIMSVMPKTAYQQGIPKHWLKRDPFDYYWPSFANIGEQPIERRELFAYTIDGSDTFGYIPRYSEYKYMPSRVSGDFRTNLNFWHLGRIFTGQPELNETFILCNPSDRIFAVTDPDIEKMYCHILHKVRAVRAMPKYGTPTF